MKNTQKWLDWIREHALILKLVLGLLLFFWLGGINCLQMVMGDSPKTYLSALDWYGQPKSGLSQEAFADWRKRYDAVEREFKVIFQEAERQRDGYTRLAYFQDMARVMDLEDKYRMDLTSGFGPLHNLNNVSTTARKLRSREPVETEEEEQFIASIQAKFEQRCRFVSDRKPFDWAAVGLWLIAAYLKLMLFWLLIYLIRFREHARRHSLRAELQLCPRRFLQRVILWPKGCLAYPMHEDTAEVLRYVRLKAHYLRSKPFGYQLSRSEEDDLHQLAKQSFGEALEALLAQFGSEVVRKTLMVAYLSLLLGIVLHPAILLAAKASDKAKAHFFGDNQPQMVLVLDSQLQGNEVRGPPQNNDNDGGGAWDLLAELAEWLCLMVWMDEVVESFRLTLPLLVFEIDCIPISRLFGAVRFFRKPT